MIGKILQTIRRHPIIAVIYQYMICTLNEDPRRSHIPRATEGGAFKVTGSLATPEVATPQGAYPLALNKDTTILNAYGIVWYWGVVLGALVASETA